MIPPISRAGQLLWRLLPGVYRERDGRGGVDPKRPTKPIQARGDLANYLDAYGVVLDQLRATLEQRLRDTSPNVEQDAEPYQSWLIPYFADLLDVRLVSPDLEGQREEVSRAVAWRQRKGTGVSVLEIAKSVGRLERRVLDALEAGVPPRFSAQPTVVVQEGFRRVVTTVTIGAPLPTLRTLGEPDPAPSTPGEASSGQPMQPLAAALNPALPVGTVDFRFASRARQVEHVSLGSQAQAFPLPAAPSGESSHYGARVVWRQEHRRGVPCHLDSYQDGSVRTVDLRTPSYRTGHYHPRRVLLYAEPASGFFSREALRLSLTALIQLLQGHDEPHALTRDTLDGVLTEREHWTRAHHPSPPLPGFCLLERELTRPDGGRRHALLAGLLAAGAGSEGSATLPPARTETLNGIEYRLCAGFELVAEYSPEATRADRRTLTGFGQVHPLLYVGAPGAPGLLDASQLGESESYAFVNLALPGDLRVRGARLDFMRAAARRLEVDLTALDPEAAAAAPSAEGGALLLPGVKVTDSLLAELSVSGELGCRCEYATVLEALQCSVLEASDSILLGANTASLQTLRLRYTCAPWLPDAPVDPARGRVLAESITRELPLFVSETFATPGAGVLHPACPKSIREGAEVGGELGAYNYRHHVRREQALLDKLRSFLPVTLEPVLIPHRPWTAPVRPL